jgi:nucleoid-associated protein YgaU
VLVTSAGERIRGLLALVAITVLVVGVPWALWSVGGSPWPAEAPSTDWLTDELGSTQILSVLTVVLWLAWAHFTVCLAVELVQAHTSGRRTSVPGGGVGTQALARRLVAAVMLVAGSAALVVPTATAVTSSSHATVSTAGAEAGVAPDTAASQTGPRTGRATGGPDVHARHSVVADQGKHYVVQPHHGRHYDSLWDIAERFLGDGMRWREIHQLNKGVAQPDGGSLQDPDLIYPGWRLTLPDDARGAGVIDVRDSGTRGEREPQARNAVNPGNGSDTIHNEPVEAAAGEASLLSSTPGDLSAQLGVAGGLVAAGLLFGLKRRRGWNGGGGPRGGGGLKPEDEVGLRLAADVAGASVVDRALRQAAHASASAGHQLGTVRAAYLDQHTFSVSFASPSTTPAPAGWRATPDGRMWTVERDVALRFEPPPGTPSPCPGLVTVGTGIQDTLVMLDLTSAPGVIALAGGQPVASSIALSMMVELATNPWSDRIRVCAAGLDDDTATALTDIAPDRVRHVRDLDTFLRASRDDRDDRPELLVCFTAPDGEHADALTAVARDAGRPVSVMVVGDHGVDTAPWQLQVGADCTLSNPLLGLDVAAQSLRPGLLTTVGAMFRAADGERASAHADLVLSSVPGFDAALLELTSAPPVSVRVLGPVEVQAPGPIDDARRELATEIVTYVALNPAGVHPGVLASAVWPRGVSTEVFDATLEHVQRWLGDNATGRPRLAADEQGRLRLDLRDVRVDWHVLQTRYERAQQVGDPTLDLAAGLACVEGQALAELPAGRYSWLAHSTLPRDLQVLTVKASLQLAEVAEATGNVELASQALRTGLDMVPACEELWRRELELTAEHTPDQLRETVTQMYASLEQHGSPRGAEATTTALVEELLPGGGRTRVVQTA